MTSEISFHHKILRGFLKLSQASPVPSLYFLLGELPLECKLHLDLLSLFYNIWINPASKVFQITRYILMICDLNSTTWANHIRLICMQYSLTDPLALLQQSPPTKAAWRQLTWTKITVYAERKWRQLAASNSKMEYLNVELLGLSGRPHPVLSTVITTRDVVRLRIHMKFLTGDYLSYYRLANDRKSGDPHCRLCDSSCEDIRHILTECGGTSDIRERLYPDLANAVAAINPNSKVLNFSTMTTTTLTQFLLDCGSPNLSNDYRLDYSHPAISEVFRISRDWCYAVSNARTKRLREQEK